MLSLVQLEFKNWCQHRHLVIPFSRTTTGLIGRNGAGKSNAISGLHFALTGAPLTEAANDGCINFDADEASLTLSFMVGSVKGTLVRTLSAPRREGGWREPCKTGATLTIEGEEPIKGVKLVGTRMVELLSAEKRVLSKHVFISQNDLNGLLFSTPAERSDALILLMEEIGRAEWLRTELARELLAVPDVVIATSSVELRALLAGDVKLCSAAAAAAADVEQQLKTLSAAVGPAHTALLADDNAAEAERKLVAARKQLASLGDVEAKEARFAAVCQRLSELIALAPGLSAQASAARKELQQSADAEAAARVLAAAVARLQAARDARDVHMSLAAPVPPTPAECAALDALDELRNKKALQELDAEQWLSRYGTGKCPTCGSPFGGGEDVAAAKRVELTTLRAELEVIRTQRKAARDSAEKRAGDAARYQAKRDQLQADVARYTEEHADAAARATTVPATAARKGELNMAIAACTAAEAELSRLTTESATLKAETVAGSGQKAALCATIAHLEAAAKAGRLTANERTSYDSIIAAEAAARTAHAKHTEAAAVHGRGIEQMQRQVDAAEALEREVVVRRAYRQRLEDARDILHRDKLPTRLLAQKAVALRDSCNRFLRLFGTPFVLHMDGQMQMTVTKPGGPVQPLFMLSGGERSVLSVCMRFAVNELFSRSLGLLVLDEPSASMDRDNVMAMRRLFEQVHTVSLKTGVQTVVITHHAEMLGAFDRVVEIGQEDECRK